MKRDLIYTQEFMEFLKEATPRVREKLYYASSILETVTPVPAKFVKKLINTDFYELRISVDNEIRVILFAVNNDNINLATSIIVLNGFIKKSNRDYDKEIIKAINILRRVL